MIKPIQKYLNMLNRLLDALLIVGAYFLATWLYLTVIKESASNIALTLQTAWLVAIVYAVTTLLIYQIMGLYDSLRARPVGREILRVFQGNALGIVIVAAALYVLRLSEFSRGVLVFFYLLSSLLIMGKRLTMRYVLHYFRALGYNQKHVIVVGDGPLAAQYIETIRSHPKYGYTIHGYIGREHVFGDIPCLGDETQLTSLLIGSSIDEVIAALEPENAAHLPEIISATEKQGTKVSILPFFSNYIPASTSIEVLNGIKLINVRTTPLDNPLYATIKRTGDVLGALFLILLSSPLLLFAALGTKLSSPGPCIFRQERIGRNKKPFTMYKFRSMRVNSEETTAWTRDTDPRKTRFGSFLRKTSLDELPQFFNVLKGDMSLVGPRPEIPHFVEQFRETIPLYMVKHRVRPGITGWAQVNGFRGDTSIEERIRCDIWYIEHWSIWLDLRILFMTVLGGMVNREKLTKGAE